MSPRAACRLESFGFDQVYDYTAGIADWKAAGLKIEGEEDTGLTISDATRPDIPTAEPHEALGDVFERTTSAGWDEALVVDCDGIVVGRLRGDAWSTDPATAVSEAMELGPMTVRPDGSLHALVTRMEERDTRLVVVTDPQGRLIGALLSEDAVRLAAGEAPEFVWRDCEGCPGRWEPAPVTN
ncbi:MAG: CBS domain-containing protein [Acidimicrobiia bacterium]